MALLSYLGLGVPFGTDACVLKNPENEDDSFSY
jgi:hypothetical protein